MPRTTPPQYASRRTDGLASARRLCLAAALLVGSGSSVGCEHGRARLAAAELQLRQAREQLHQQRAELQLAKARAEAAREEVESCQRRERQCDAANRSNLEVYSRLLAQRSNKPAGEQTPALQSVPTAPPQVELDTRLRSAELSLRAAALAGEPGSAVFQALPLAMWAALPELQRGEYSAVVWEGLVEALSRVAFLPSGVPLGIRGRIVRMALSADARRLATLDGTGQIFVWDVEAERVVGSFRAAVTRMDRGGAEHGPLALSADGQLLAFQVENGAVGVADAATGQALWQVRAPRWFRWCRIAEFSPDGRFLALYFSYDRVIKFFDARRGTLIKELPAPSLLGSIQFFPDGRKFVAAAADGPVIVELDSGASVQKLMEHRFSPSVARLSPGARFLVSAGEDPEAKVWDLARGGFAYLVRGHSSLHRDAAFSPDNRYLVTTSHDRTGRLWENQSPYRHLLTFGHDEHPLFFTRDGRLLTVADNQLVRWDLRQNRLVTPIGSGSESGRIATMSHAADLLAVGTGQGSLHIVDAHTGRLVRTLAQRAFQRIDTLAFSRDDQHLLATTIGRGTGALVWDLRSEREPLRLGCPGEDGRHRYAATWSPDGEFVAVSAGDALCVRRIRDGQMVWSLPVHPKQPVRALAFSPDGATLAVSFLQHGTDATAPMQFYDWRRGSRVLAWPAPPWGPTGLAYSPDGSLLLLVYPGVVELWDTAAGSKKQELKNSEVRTRTTVPSAHFSPDGRRVITLSDDKRMRLFDVDSGRELLRLGSQTQQPLSVEFTPDGRSLLTASADAVAALQPATPEGIFAFACQVIAAPLDRPIWTGPEKDPVEAACRNLAAQQEPRPLKVP